MFDNYDAVSDSRKAFEVLYEHLIVSRVKSYRWFIEDIDDSLEARPYLCCETDTLALTAGERVGTTRECHIVETDTREELESLCDVLHDGEGDLFFFLREDKSIEKYSRFFDRETRKFANVFSSYQYGKVLFFESMPATCSTDLFCGEVGDTFEKCIISHIRFLVSALEIGYESLILRSMRFPFVELSDIGNFE